MCVQEIWDLVLTQRRCFIVQCSSEAFTTEIGSYFLALSTRWLSSYFIHYNHWKDYSPIYQVLLQCAALWEIRRLAKTVSNFRLVLWHIFNCSFHALWCLWWSHWSCCAEREIGQEVDAWWWRHVVRVHLINAEDNKGRMICITCRWSPGYDWVPCLRSVPNKLFVSQKWTKTICGWESQKQLWRESK